MLRQRLLDPILETDEYAYFLAWNDAVQGGNMTGGGNATEGNMTGTDTAGSGVATPPMMTP
jgi:hypothetical protein